ncbi:MAG: hypothetical protein U0521_09585 [Anaerolineae bacterium]
MTGSASYMPSTSLSSGDSKFFLRRPEHATVLAGDTSQFRARPKIDRGSLLRSAVAILMVALFLVAVTGVWKEWRNIYLRLFGLPASGIVTSRHSEQSCDDSGCSDTLYLSYHFSVAEQGEFYTNDEVVGSEMYELLPEGTPIEVVFVPSLPTISAPLSITYQSPNITLIGLGIGGVVTLAALMRYRRLSRLRKEGRVIEGRLDDCAIREVDDGEGGKNFEIVFWIRFPTPDGRTLTATVAYRLAPFQFVYKAFERAVPGARIAVLFVNDNLYEML